jgi:hypothetical protein
MKKDPSRDEIGELPTPKPIVRDPRQWCAHVALVYLRNFHVGLVMAFGINRMDISQREGKYPAPRGPSTVPGVEFSGIVIESGANLKWRGALDS